MIAVFTLLGFTYPYLKEKLQPLNTELKAALMGTSSKYVYILFSNTGNRPGTIKNIFFTDLRIAKKLSPGKSSGAISPGYYAKAFEEFVVIEPGDLEVVKLPIGSFPLVFPEYLDDPKLNEYKSVCMLGIDAVEYDGSSAEAINIFYPCIPHALKDEWLKEELSVGVKSKDITNIFKELESQPELYRFFKERTRREAELNELFEKDLDLF